MEKSTSFPIGKSGKISISDKLPETLPSDATIIPDTKFVVIFAHSAATLLMPIPFAGEAIEQEIMERKSESYRNQYVNIDIQQIATETFSSSDLYSKAPTKLQIHPVAYVQECIDEVFRISLAVHLESPDWKGRYLYHLPSTIPVKDIKNPTPEELNALRAEMKQGFKTLFNMLERDVNGNLNSTNVLVDFGSLYLYGSRLAGVASPYIIHLPDGQLVEEGDDHIIFRHSGDMSQPGGSGSLLFGVHYFYKNQFHKLEIKNNESLETSMK